MPSPLTPSGLSASPLVSSVSQPVIITTSPSQPGAPSPFASQAGPALPLFGSQAAQPSPLAPHLQGAEATGTSPTTAVSTFAGGSAVASPKKNVLDMLKGKKVPRTALIGGGAGLFVLVLGIVLYSWYRNAYSRGLVLEHVPEDCAYFVYVDVEGIATSDMVKPNLERGLKNAKEVALDTTKSHKDKVRMEEVLDILKGKNIDNTTLREVAVCIRPSDDKGKVGSFEENGIILLGGSFRRSDPLGAIKDGLEAYTGKEDLCKEEDDDFKILKCSVDKGEKRAPFYAGLVDGRVLAISGDKRLLKSVRTPKNVAKAYGADKGEHFVYFTSKDAMGFDGTYGDTKIKIGKNDTILAVETYYDADKGKAKLAEIKDPDAFVKKKEGFFKAASKTCFTNADDYDMLADAIESAKVEAFEDGAKYELKVANKDLSKLFKQLSDIEIKDIEVLDRLSSCVMKTVEPPSAYPSSFGYDQ
jgi:hypothetical protein